MMKVIKHLLLLGLLGIPNILAAQSTIGGMVFSDINQNRILDVGEKGIPNVLISDGNTIVASDHSGRWKLKGDSGQLVFVIKPSGYQVPVNSSMVPIHFAEGTKQKEVLFPLWEKEEPEKFEALFFGDTQARGLTEVNYVSHDVVEECIGSSAAFGVTLGDIVADDPELFDEIAESIGKIGIPWYYVFGNHDHDKDAKGNDGADKTFKKNFGPSTYAYEVGKVSFIAFNNINYKETGGYKGHFTESQIRFVSSYMDHVPKENLVVLMMHIPVIGCDNREELFRIIEKHPNTLSIAGHTHELSNVFIDASRGWNGQLPHHLFINGTVCGSWWCGIKDESGIPHATMNDGAPNGYAVIAFDGNKYNIRYKAARRPVDYQMNIYLPEEIGVTAIDTVKVLVNVFNGTSKSVVSMTIDGSGDSYPLQQVRTQDPLVANMHLLGTYLDTQIGDKKLDQVFGWKMDSPSLSDHFWQGQLPKTLLPGTHSVKVVTTDMFGNQYHSHRIFRIIP
jgi:hypothetical protein